MAHKLRFHLTHFPKQDDLDEFDGPSDEEEEFLLAPENQGMTSAGRGTPMCFFLRSLLFAKFVPFALVYSVHSFRFLGNSKGG